MVVVKTLHFQCTGLSSILVRELRPHVFCGTAKKNYLIIKKKKKRRKPVYSKDFIEF